MDHHVLVPIAQLAILQALNYHFLLKENGRVLPALDQETQESIRRDIQNNLPLEACAADKQVAYLEIVSDAAIPVAEKYQLNKCWFYTSVQALTSMELLPIYHERRGDPDRLDRAKLLEHAGITSLASKKTDVDQEEGDAAPAAPAPATDTVAPPRNKTQRWSDDDIKMLIDLHLAGTGHKSVAEKLGYTHNSVKFNWRKANKPESPWKGYIEIQTAALAAADRDNKAEPASECAISDTSTSDDEGEEVAEAVGNVQPAAAATAAAAVGPAVPEPKRPWTDADIKQLIDLRFDGMSTSAISKLVRRHHGSVHSTWLNVAASPGNKWFAYVHKKFRAEKKQKQKQKEKEKEKEKLNGAGANSEPGAVSISSILYVEPHWQFRDWS
jgi:hypothetical protein